MNPYEAAWRALETELESQVQDLERASRDAAWEVLQAAGSPSGDVSALAARNADLQRRRDERAELLARMRATLALAKRGAC